MTVSISAVAISSLRVKVSVTDTAPAGKFTLYADDLQGPRRPVRGAVGIPAQTSVWDDVEAPLNRPVWYVAVYSSGLEVITSTPVVVESPLPVLSDPETGQWAHVTIVELPEQAYRTRASMVDVEGARQRVRLFDVESSPFLPTVVLRTVTTEQLKALRGIAASGRTMLLRGGRDGIEDCYVGQVGERTEQRVSMKADDWRRNHPWKDVEVLLQPDPTERARGGDTLLELSQAAATLGAIASIWSTLGGIASADLDTLT